RVVPLLPVAPARAKSELEASVERLFDEGGGADQGDSAAREEASCYTCCGSSYPPKKLSGDYKTFGEAATSGKSLSVLKELLASNILNVEAGVAVVATLPMVTSSVSTTPEHESGPPTDSITRLNLRTLGPTAKRFVISLDSSHHSSTNAAEAGIDSFVRYVAPLLVMTEAMITTNIASILSVSAPKTGTKVISPVHASMFHDFNSTGTF
ncbi:hypothetical protein Tco_0208168, partial [Tanacetum coccineum]